MTMLEGKLNNMETHNSFDESLFSYKKLKSSNGDNPALDRKGTNTSQSLQDS